MPARNTVKKYSEHQMWHVYNRGYDKKIVFIDDQDYNVFLSYLKCCLLPEIEKETLSQYVDHLEVERMRRMMLHDKIELVSYCLMPNHFHLQLYQKSKDAVSKLMKSVTIGYVMYFNHKYKRTGRLFEGIFKASEIGSESYWQHISRYIHLNPIDIQGQDFKTYEYSSYKYFINDSKMPEWLSPNKALSSFSNSDGYADFCSEYTDKHKEINQIKDHLADH